MNFCSAEAACENLIEYGHRGFGGFFSNIGVSKDLTNQKFFLQLRTSSNTVASAQLYNFTIEHHCLKHFLSFKLYINTNSLHSSIYLV